MLFVKFYLWKKQQLTNNILKNISSCVSFIDLRFVRKLGTTKYKLSWSLVKSWRGKHPACRTEMTRIVQNGNRGVTAMQKRKDLKPHGG